MKRPKPVARRPARPGAVQYFTYGPWEFNVTRALALAQSPKYKPLYHRPDPAWIAPHIEINEAHVEQCDLRRPVVFATVLGPEGPRRLLIDGNHRVAKALRRQACVPAVTLDLEDTLQVLSAPPGVVQEMRRTGQRLGLLPPKRW